MTINSTYYFVIYSLVYFFSNGHLSLHSPDFNFIGNNRFFYDFSNNNDLSKIPVEIVEKVLLVVDENREQFIINKLDGYSKLLKRLEQNPTFKHYYDEEDLSYFRSAKFGQYLIGRNYYYDDGKLYF